jgi:hypothetical protein
VAEVPVPRSRVRKCERTRKRGGALRPDTNEDDERVYFGRVPLHIVEQFGELSNRTLGRLEREKRAIAYSQEGIRNIHAHIDSIANECEVDEVTPSRRGLDKIGGLRSECVKIYKPDEPESDKVMSDEFVVVFSGLLKSEDQNEELLAPVGGLGEVVSLELGLHVPVGIVYRMSFLVSF